MRVFLSAVFILVLSILNFSWSSEIQRKGILIPAYFYDSAIWDRLIAGKNDNVDFIVIVNPASGPGDIQDPHYVSVINDLNANGIIPIGYVHTSYGNRDINEVKDEINRWLELYPGIKGFFLDEVSSSNSDIDYYSQLYSFIKEKGNYKVVLNPGTSTDIEYYGVSDLIVTYESPYEDFTGCNGDIPEKSACIVYNVPEDKIAEIINNENVKFFYLTDDTLPNPYDTLPTYYEEEVSLLANQGISSFAKGIIIPAYFDDSNLWSRILSLDIEGVKVITIINPANGVGYSYDPNYRNIIDQLNRKGIVPIGYVYTDYGRRSIRAVKREIRRWIRWYPGIKGFFIDQASTERRKLRYYKKLYRYIKRKGNYLVVLDPGAPTYRGYYRFADIIVTSVNNYQEYSECDVQVPNKNGCILYNASYTDMLNKIRNEKVEYIYITDDADPNPFDQLPSYLEEELELIKEWTR